jgi:hypothetical protein
MSSVASIVSIAGLSITVLPVLAEPVGKAVSVKTIVSSDRGELKRADPVNRDEVIRTNGTGLGHFQFADGAKLAVGPNSRVKIDEYVLGSGNRVKKLALNSTKGAFRWISGRSPSSAYQIATPQGTLGVRGTAVDLYVRNGTALMVLLSGSAQWCLPGQRGNCVTVRRPCDFIMASGGNVTDPQRINASAVGGFTNLYFFSNSERLLPAFRAQRANCGLGTPRLRTRAGSDGSSQNRGGTSQSPGGGGGGGGEGEGDIR